MSSCAIYSTNLACLDVATPYEDNSVFIVADEPPFKQAFPDTPIGDGESHPLSGGMWRRARVRVDRACRSSRQKPPSMRILLADPDHELAAALSRAAAATSSTCDPCPRERVRDSSHFSHVIGIWLIPALESV